MSWKTMLVEDITASQLWRILDLLAGFIMLFSLLEYQFLMLWVLGDVVLLFLVDLF